MLKQFAIARFIIGFIVFILAYMVASMSYDIFIHFLTAGMFILTLWIMREMQRGMKEQLARQDAHWEEKLAEIQNELVEKQKEIDSLRGHQDNLPE